MTEELSWFQTQGYIHRDIKPQNMILNFDLTRYGDLVVREVTFVDLTSIKKLPSGEKTLSCEFFGTRFYSPAELTESEEGAVYSLQSDIYSLTMSFCFPQLGVVETGKSCFERGKIKIELTDYFKAHTDEETQKKLIQLIERGLSSNPEERPAIEFLMSEIERIQERVFNYQQQFTESCFSSDTLESLSGSSLFKESASVKTQASEKRLKKADSSAALTHLYNNQKGAKRPSLLDEARNEGGSQAISPPSKAR